MPDLMSEFPPPAEAQVTLANWRTGPFNKWAFHHVREIVPSVDIPNDPDNVWELESEPKDLNGLPVALSETEKPTLGELLRRSDTDAFVVLHRGRLVFETHANGMTPHTPHILMSVSKSMLGLLAGIVVERGELSPEDLVTTHVPELEATAYGEATVRQLLDMQVGVKFDENYEATGGPMIEYRRSTNWNPPEPGREAVDLRSFLRTLVERDGPHGGRFHYVSPNTDLMAWVIERATGRRYADLMSELLWRPMGAERPGYVTVDRLGAPRAAGGMCVTARDLARVGQLFLRNGRRDDGQIVPHSWLDDIENGGSRKAWDEGDFATDLLPGCPIRYRSKWYILEGETPLVQGLGIHDQYLFIDRTNEIVVAKMSSAPDALTPGREMMVVKAIDAIRGHLSG